MRLALLVPFFLSGFAALVDEIVWTRALYHVLGGTAETFALILVVFSSGLALGGLLGGSRRLQGGSALTWYAILQLAIAFFAAVSCPVLEALSGIGRLGLSGTADSVLRTTLAVAFLGVPTIAMGATFPLGCRALADRVDRLGRSAAWITAAGSLGAVVGSLSAGAFLVRDFGFRGSSFVAASVSVLASVAAVVVVLRTRGRSSAEPHVTPPLLGDHGSGPAASRFGAWFAAFIAGFALLGLEVLWSREMAFFVEGFTISVGLLVAAVLFGLVVGSVAASWHADRSRDPARFAGALLALAGAFTLGSLALFEWGGDVVESLRARSVSAGGWATLAGLFVIALAVAFPTSACLGGVVPAAVRGFGIDRAPSRAAAGFAFANNAGAALGAIAAVVLGLAVLGLKPSLFLVSSMLLLGGALLVSSRSRRVRTRVGLPALVIVGLGIAAIAFPLDTPPIESSHVFRGEKGHERELVASAEGSAFAVAVVHDVRTKELFLYTDEFLAAGTGDPYAYMRLLGHLPALLARDPGRALVIGFGSGTTAGSLARHQSLRSIEVCELSPEVLAMAPHFSQWNGGVLADPRVQTIVGDGRRRLAATEERFDVITLEPLMPYTPGAVSLYSREFYRLASSRLNPGGLVCQWMPLHALRTEHFLHLLAAFVREFPYASVWYFEQSALFLGSMDPIRIDVAELIRRFDEPAVSADLRDALVDSPAELIGGGFIAADERLRQAIGDDPGLTDDRPVTEFFPIPRGTATTYAQDNLSALRVLLAPLDGRLVDLGALDAPRAAAFRTAMDASRTALRDILHGKAAIDLANYRALTGDAQGSADALADALSAFRSATEADADNRPALRGIREAHFRIDLGRGRDALDRGDFDAAISVLREAVDLAPDRDLGHAWLGAALAGAGRTSEGENELRRALEIFPSSVPALVHLGCLLGRLGRREEARGLLHRAFEITSQPEVAPDVIAFARRLLRES
ncbi:MAG: fused MFS/spermidine synthase [Planctomycetes bacterium]|nr:fused MFS/spermidine synthase [Planctomycetota bacterium]